MAETERYILVINEDAEVRHEIVKSLDFGSWRCREFDSAQAALELAQDEPPLLIILDLYYRDLSGLMLCGMLRTKPGLERVPLFVVSDRADEIDRVLAFEFGADDFLPRPFFPRELAARVRALLRGFEDPPVANSTRTAGTLRIDLDQLRAEVSGRRIDLTPKELQILAELLASAGKVVRRRELIERLWGSESAIGGRAIDAHIKNIRQKLGASRTQLETVRGVGYRISEAD